jgi:hypothetical protein
MEVRRNSRFDIGQNVHILFNPISKLINGELSNSLTFGILESFVEFRGYYGATTAINTNDVIANKYFGGRVESKWLSSIAIGVPYDAFAEEIDNYIENYKKVDTFVFQQTLGNEYNEYFYCNNGSGYLQIQYSEETGGYENRIADAYITERSIKVSNQKFGYGFQHFNNSWEDVIKVAIPATTPEWKLTQMLNSEAIAIKGNSDLYGITKSEIGEYGEEYDTEYGEDIVGSGSYTLVEDYNYYKQNGGGSCNPVIRLANLNRQTLTFNKRRNVFEIEIVIMG